MNTFLRETVQNMPLKEQFGFLDFLWEQLAEPLNDLPVPEQEKRILEERIAQMQQSPKEAKPWREFLNKTIQNKSLEKPINRSFSSNVLSEFSKL
jgi:Putative addiction module component